MGTKTILYPFNKETGELLHWADEKNLGFIASQNVCRNIEWKENFTFTENLQFSSVIRGRSAVTFIWKDEGGKFYPMMIKDLTLLLQKGTIVDGKVFYGEWTFVKRGSNYGITCYGN